MRRTSRANRGAWGASLLVLVCFGLAVRADPAVEAAEPGEPVRLIFDTDIGNDVDDVLALGVIHALESRGHCRLLAVTITKDQPLAAEFVDAVNTFYGRGSVPVGMVNEGVTPDPGKFLKLAHARDEGQLRYPHSLKQNEVPGATKLLRTVLAGQPDGSVVIVQVGFSTNLARLLASSPDAVSDLSGTELVRRKVRFLSMMAGDFSEGQDRENFIEYNIKMDVPSARRVIEKWPTPILLSGFEIGIAIRYPAKSIERDYGYVSHHPLAEAYQLYNPPPHNRPTWDLTSVLYAILPDRGYFDLSPPGSVRMDPEGVVGFEESPGGKHRYLRASPIQVARVREALVQLASQPPDAHVETKTRE